MFLLGSCREEGPSHLNVMLFVTGRWEQHMLLLLILLFKGTSAFLYSKPLGASSSDATVTLFSSSPEKNDAGSTTSRRRPLQTQPSTPEQQSGNALASWQRLRSGGERLPHRGAYAAALKVSGDPGKLKLTALLHNGDPIIVVAMACCGVTKTCCGVCDRIANGWETPRMR